MQDRSVRITFRYLTPDQMPHYWYCVVDRTIAEGVIVRSNERVYETTLVPWGSVHSIAVGCEGVSPEELLAYDRGEGADE